MSHESFPSSFDGHCTRTISLRHCLRSCWLLIFNTFMSRLQSPLVRKAISRCFDSSRMNQPMVTQSLWKLYLVRSGKDMSLFPPWLRFPECCARVFLKALPGCRSGFRPSAASHRAVSKEKCCQGLRDEVANNAFQQLGTPNLLALWWGVDGQVQELSASNEWLVGLRHASTCFWFFGVQFEGLHPSY